MLIVAGLGVATVGGLFVAKKAKDFVEEVADDPAAAAAMAAEAIVRINPELEMVESDRDSGTMTIREKATGKVVTVSYEDIEQGRLTIDSEDGTYEIDAEAATRGEPVARFSNTDGSETMTVGGAGSEPPEWLLYPDTAEVFGGSVNLQAGVASGMHSFRTGDSVDDVIAHYRELVEQRGLEPRVTQSADGGLISASGDGTVLQITIGAEEEGSEVTIVYRVPESR